MADAKYAFRCRNCLHLEDGAAAGENTLPVACRNCGHGVREPENWIVLKDLKSEELAEILEYHGIKATQIEKYEPTMKVVKDEG